MADPLSIAGSIAGLITIADVVIRNGYKYIAAVKGADKAVVSLVQETNSLVGVLHSLRNVAEGLEGGNVPFLATTQVHHIESCFRTLKKIQTLLDKFEISKSKDLIHRSVQHLKWPLAESQTKSLASEVSGHRETLALALNADEMSALIVLLARQDIHTSTLSKIEDILVKDREQRDTVRINDRRQKILDWLCPRNIDPYRNQESAVSLRQPGTGVWFTDSIDFREWKLKTNSKLWLYGIPGAGKTILMSTIIQEVDKITNIDEGFAFFYCDYKDAATHEISNILGSLVKQLVSTNEAAFQLLEPFYEGHYHSASGHRQPSAESVIRLLHSITDLFSLATIIIDGLDEISTNRFDTVDLLRAIQEEDRSIRVLFASRLEPDIEQCLSDFESVSIAARSSDLELYVASEIGKRTRKKELNIKDKELEGLIINRLVHGADGMFRWVACQIDHLCDLPNDRARSKALDQLPRGLPETYDRILGRVLERHEDIHSLVSMTLQWLICAEEALSQRALLEAISITPGDTHLHPSAIVSEDDLLKWCSSLIRRRADGDGIEIAHFTVKEYLTSAGAGKDQSGHKDPRFALFIIDPKESDRALGQVCLTYLNMSHLDIPPPDGIWDNVNHGLPSNPDVVGTSYGNSHEDSKSGSNTNNDINSKVKGGAEDNKTHNPTPGNSLHHEVSLQQENTGPSVTRGRRSSRKVTGSRSQPFLAFEQYLERFPLLDYAANHWQSHLESFMSDPVASRLSRRLFAKEKSYQFIWWSYAYSYDILQERRSEPFSDLTTLHWAAIIESPDLCSWLVDDGSDVNRTSRLGSPLDCALGQFSTLCQFDRAAYLKLMDEEASQDFRDPELSEYYKSKFTIIKGLIDKGAGLAKITHPYIKATPLGLALVTHPENPDIIQLFLDRGALVTEAEIEIIKQFLARNKEVASLSALPLGLAVLFSKPAHKSVSIAALAPYQELFTRLTENPKPDYESSADLEDDISLDLLRDELVQAAQHGMYRVVKRIATELQGSGYDETESTLARGLCKALQNCHEEIPRYLLEIGASPNRKDEFGNTPAHAILQPHLTLGADYIIDQIKLLLDFGTDISIFNNDSEQAIHLAARSKHEHLLESFVGLIGEAKFQEFLVIFKPSLLQYAAMEGSDSAFRLIIQHAGMIDLANHQCKDGTSLMGLTALRQTDVALQILHQRGLSIETLSQDGSSVLFHATKSEFDEPFEFLIEAGAIDTSARPDGRKAIHEAAQPLKRSKLAKLLKAGHDPNFKDSDGSTPLHLAVLYEDPEVGDLDSPLAGGCVLGLLLGDPRIEVDSQDATGVTAMMKCLQEVLFIHSDKMLGIQKHPFNNAEFLINHKPNLLLADQKRQTALHFLCRNGMSQKSFALAKILVASGASLTAKDDIGISPFELMFAYCVDSERSACFMESEGFHRKDVLQYAIDDASSSLNEPLSQAGGRGLCPLSFALRKKSQLAVDILLSKPEVTVDIRGTDKDRLSSLELAACWGCTGDTARILLSRTTNDFSTLDPVYGNSILHWTTGNPSDRSVLKELLQRKVDLECLNKASATALYTAIHWKNAAVVNILVEAGANVKTGTGSPLKSLPVHQAVQTGQLQVLRKLIEYGADINATSANTQWTALHYACREGQLDMISFLIASGALLNERDVEGNTPYLIAARSKNWHVVHEFFTTPADFTARNLKGLNALHFAILHGSVKNVEILEKKSPSLVGDVIDSKGEICGSTLTLAIQSGSMDLVDKYWYEDAEKFVNDRGNGLGHSAVFSTPNNIRNFLLTKSIDWDLDSARWVSLQTEPDYFQLFLRPIHCAASNGLEPAITFLKDYDLVPDINVFTRGTEGYSPLHLAALSNKSSTIKLLKDCGADLDTKSRRDGQTPLHIAAKRGYSQTVIALLKAGCSPNLTDTYGMTPELLAIENGHNEVIKILSQNLDKLEAELEKVEGKSSGSIIPAVGTKIWRLPLSKSPHVADVMKEGNMTIYAVRDGERSEEIRKALEDNEGENVICLGKPYRRRI